MQFNKNQQIRLLFGMCVLFTMLIFIPLQVEALQDEKYYVMYSDNMFIVFNTQDLQQINIIDGGIYHNDVWRFFNSTTIRVLDTQDNLNKVWAVGAVESVERYYFTWILENLNSAKIGVWVFDNGEIFENNLEAHVSRLFY